MSDPHLERLDALRAAAAADPTSVRTFEPVPAEERPRRWRRTARVLLVDDRDRVLLFADTDPGLPGSHWWMTPGGGIDEHETDRAAAARELFEETGLRVAERDLFGPVLVRRVLHGYTDLVIDQEDVFYACWVPAFEVSDAGHTEEERITLSAHRWWTRQELAATDEEVWPADLLALWRDAEERRHEVAAGGPVRPPAHSGPVEESSVPV